MLYDQVIIAAGKDIFVECIETQAKYVAGVLPIHGVRAVFADIAKGLVNIPQQHALIVATCSKIRL